MVQFSLVTVKLHAKPFWLWLCASFTWKIALFRTRNLLKTTAQRQLSFKCYRFGSFICLSFLTNSHNELFTPSNSSIFENWTIPSFISVAFPLYATAIATNSSYLNVIYFCIGGLGLILFTFFCCWFSNRRHFASVYATKLTMEVKILIHQMVEYAMIFRLTFVIYFYHYERAATFGCHLIYYCFWISECNEMRATTKCVHCLRSGLCVSDWVSVIKRRCCFVCYTL